jgi:hypothetical protein
MILENVNKSRLYKLAHHRSQKINRWYLPKLFPQMSSPRATSPNQILHPQVLLCHIFRQSEFATLIGTIGIEKQRRQLSQERVFMPGTAKDGAGRIFMPWKDLPFPANILVLMVSQAQSFTTMKSSYSRPVGEWNFYSLNRFWKEFYCNSKISLIF